MKEKLRKAIAQGRRLVEAYRPLVSLMWKNYRSKFLQAVGLSIGAVFAQAGLILVLVIGLRVLNPEDSVNLFGAEVFLKANPVVTLVFIVSIYIGVGLFSAWAGWRRDRICRRIARDFMESDTRNRLDAVASAPVAPREIPRKMVNVNSAFIQGPLVCGIAFEAMLQLLTPIVQMIGFTAALLVLDWRLVFFAIPLLLFP